MPRFENLLGVTHGLLAGIVLSSYFSAGAAHAQEQVDTAAVESDTQAQAGTPNAESEPEEDCTNLFPGGFKAEKKIAPSFFSFLDGPEEALSSQLSDFVRGIDEFFANEKTFYASTGSYVRVTMDAVVTEGGNVGYSGDIRLKVKLPLTEGKLKLLLETDPDERRDRLDRRIEPTPSAVVDNRDYYAGIQASFGEERHWRLVTSTGIKIGSPLDSYVRLRTERNYIMSDAWLLTINGTAYWFDSSGTGYDGLIEFNHKLAHDLIGRSSSFARWTAETNYFSLSQVFSVIHTLSSKHAITYLTGVYGSSDPTVHVTDYLVAARYRRTLYKDFLFMELNPELRFRKENQFKDEYAFFVRLELLFLD